MDSKDSFKTIDVLSTGEYREKGSKFLAYAYPFENTALLKPIIQELRKEHLKARHHCFAYKTGIDGNSFRMNDDGEPSGTAGKPIFGQIEKLDLTDILIVVVRYFGGTKLGTTGLIRSYKSATEQALANARIVTKIKTRKLKIEFSYEKMGDVLNILKKLQKNIVDKKFEEHPFVIVALPFSEFKKSIQQIKAGLAQKSIEEITENFQIDSIKFKPFDP